ncbi:MAG: hypothetical protein JKY57_04665 [Kordiimonadaceae bacterium]|nr:hypothetical protein [Kordiimonadaceae bacterium]
MLLEMIPDMPDMVEDAAEWAPKSYPQHFLDSGFQATQLAIQAFEMAPTPIRTSFDYVCNELDQLVLGTIVGLKNLNVMERGLSAAAQELIRQRVTCTKDLLLKLNQVVNGHIDDDESFIKSITDQHANLVAETGPDITEITEEAVDHANEVQTQDDIDKLFD